MIGCSDAVRQLWEYLDEQVDAHDRAVIESHLSWCRRCCGELEFARELRRRLELSAYEEVPDAVLRRLHETLEELER